MANIVIPRGWEMPESEATSEDVYVNRRKFLKAAGAAGAAGMLAGCGSERVFEPFEPEPVATDEDEDKEEEKEEEEEEEKEEEEEVKPAYPAQTNPKFSELDRNLTNEEIAGGYNNFYEFSRGKTGVLEKAEKFVINPWTLEVKGLVSNPLTLDYDALHRRFPLEERLYRLRCVEAWSMAIPWTGFPMSALIEAVEPQSGATHVKFNTFINPDQAPGQFDNPQWPWPYQEGLRMDEAMNELTFVATGIYGHELPKQHGAPVRLVIPWKYGFKSAKSIVSIEFVAEQPATFWNELVPKEYGFLANVEPDVAHPRWSQKTERFITTDASKPLVRPTLLYNGYREFVQDMYG